MTSIPITWNYDNPVFHAGYVQVEWNSDDPDFSLFCNPWASPEVARLTQLYMDCVQHPRRLVEAWPMVSFRETADLPPLFPNYMLWDSFTTRVTGGAYYIYSLLVLHAVARCTEPVLTPTDIRRFTFIQSQMEAINAALSIRV